MDEVREGREAAGEVIEGVRERLEGVGVVVEGVIGGEMEGLEKERSSRAFARAYVGETSVEDGGEVEEEVGGIEEEGGNGGEVEGGKAGERGEEGERLGEILRSSTLELKFGESGPSRDLGEVRINISA